MKTYDDSHWVTDTTVNKKTDLQTIEAIASDLSEATRVLTELTGHYLCVGTDEESIEQVQGILSEVYDTPLDGKNRYLKAQVQSAYVLALAASDLQRFMSEAVVVMLADIEENGFADG